MRIEIINTGNELLLGSTLNRHGAWLGNQLFKLGLRVQRQITVPDGDPIRDQIKQSIERSDLLIVTGGLGPTSDDITREATADALGIELIQDEHSLRIIEAYFQKMGRPMAASNTKQADNLCGAEVLPNLKGTAPGIYVPPRLSKRNPPCAIFLLPGPPRELHPMYRAEVEPKIRALIDIADDYGMTQLKFSGIGESDFQTAIGDQLEQFEQLEIGYCARLGELDLRLIGSESSRYAAAALAQSAFPESFINCDLDSLEATVVKQLIAQKATLATAESCTGGLIASRITDVAGASQVFTHGFITYSNEAKNQLLKVPTTTITEHGAVSKATAIAMAEGALAAAASQHALAVTGIAGPTGGTTNKPVGTVFIALTSRDHPTLCIQHLYPHGRDAFKQRTSQAALMLLLRRLQPA